MINRNEIEFLDECCQCANKKIIEIYNVAVQLARMWGVMETLEEYPNKNNEDFICWAREYIESGETDITEFFKKKNMQPFIRFE